MMRSHRVLSVVIVALAALAVSQTAWAQPGPGGRGPGRGMFRPSLSMSYGMLLSAPTVQKDLDLVDDQKTKLKDINDKFRAGMRELRMEMQDLAPDEYATKGAEIGKKMQEQSDKNIKDIEGVLLPDQLKRLKGIAVQRMVAMGMTGAVFADAGIQKDLKLTDDQTTKIKSVNEDAMKKGRDLFTSGLEQDEMRQKLQQLGKETEQKVMDVLTADQKTAFEQMQGKKLDIPRSELRGMFGGRGPGGGRGNRGPGGGGNPGPGGGNPPPPTD